MATGERDPEDGGPKPSSSCLGPFSFVPVEVQNFGPGFTGQNTFTARPLFGPLLFDNETSDARDHCANERSEYSVFRHSPASSSTHSIDYSSLTCPLSSCLFHT